MVLLCQCLGRGKRPQQHHREFKMNTIKLIVALSLTASVPTALHAQSADQPKIDVITADLNLATHQGQDRLSMRINQAAKQVCGFGAGSRDLREIQSVNACIAKAKARAMRDARNQTAQQVALTSSR